MRRPITVLIALTLASTGASAYFWNELKSERAATHALEQRIAQLEKVAVDRAPPPAAVSEQLPVSAEPAPLQTKVKTQPRNDAPHPPAPLVAFSGSGAAMSGGMRMPDAEMRRRIQEARAQQRRLMQDPEYRELMRAQQKYSMSHLYGDLEVMMGLTKEESERLRDLIAEQQLRQMENQPGAAAFDGAPPDPAKMHEFQQRMQDLQRKNDEEIAALLGSKHSAWKEYQQNSAARMQVTQLRQALATTDEPLLPEQVKPLVDAFAQEQKQVEQETRAQLQPSAYRQMDTAARLSMQEDWLERRIQTNERIRSAVSSLLSPAQLERLMQQQDQEIKMQQMQLKMQRAQAEARARGELPTDDESATMMSVPGTIAIAD